MPAQCPKCNSQIHKVIADHVDVNVVGGKTWHGISYACPSCSVLLSVAIDPISLKADTVEGTVAAVAQHLHSLEARHFLRIRSYGLKQVFQATSVASAWSFWISSSRRSSATRSGRGNASAGGRSAAQFGRRMRR